MFLNARHHKRVPALPAAGLSPGCSSIMSAGEKNDTDSYCAYMEWTIGSIDAERAQELRKAGAGWVMSSNVSTPPPRFGVSRSDDAKPGQR